MLIFVLSEVSIIKKTKREQHNGSLHFLLPLQMCFLSVHRLNEPALEQTVFFSVD